MRTLLIRFFINAVCIGILVSGILPGIRISGNNLATLVVVAVIFGVANAIIKPILTLFTCPLVLITLGLFLVVINAVMLQLTAWVSNLLASSFSVGGSLMIDNFGWAVVGAVIVMIVNFILEQLLKPEDRVVVQRVEVRTIYDRRRDELDRDFDRIASDDDLIDPKTGLPRR